MFGFQGWGRGSIISPVAPEQSLPSERFGHPNGATGPYNIGLPPVTGTTAPEM
jgi:hypothetical protein